MIMPVGGKTATNLINLNKLVYRELLMISLKLTLSTLLRLQVSLVLEQGLNGEMLS